MSLEKIRNYATSRNKDTLHSLSFQQVFETHDQLLKALTELVNLANDGGTNSIDRCSSLKLMKEFAKGSTSKTMIMDVIKCINTFEWRINQHESRGQMQEKLRRHQQDSIVL